MHAPEPAASRAPARGGWWLAAPVAVLVPLGFVLVRQGRGEGRQAFEAELLYWMMPVLVLLWALVGAWRLRAAGFRPGASLRTAMPGLVGALALVLLVVKVSPPAMRVQFDETSLVSVSWGMHAQRAAVLTTTAVPFDGKVLGLESTVDKRPPLFAFLVSLVHDATGYRPGNAFVVNAALLGLLLAMVHAAVRRRLGLVAAFAAQLLLVAVPLLDVVATSAGFELLAVVLLAGTVLAGLDCASAPEPVRQAWLLANCLLLANARYESLVAAGVVFGLVLWRTRGAGLGDGRCRWLLALAPGLLTPLVFLFENARRPDFYPEAMGQPLVALQHGLDHVGPLLAALFAPGLAHAMPGLLAGFGAVACVVRLLQRRGGFGDLLVALPVLLLTTISLVWFYGDVREPTALRLFLPIAVAAVPAVLLCLDGYGRRWATVALLAGAALFAGLRLGALQRGEALPRLQIAATTAAIDAALAAVPGADARTLWVTCAAQHLVVKGRAAMPAEALRRRWNDVQQLLRNRQIEQVLLLGTPLDAAFAPQFGALEPVLAAFRNEVAWRSAGDVPLTVWRLRL